MANTTYRRAGWLSRRAKAVSSVINPLSEGGLISQGAQAGRTLIQQQRERSDRANAEIKEANRLWLDKQAATLTKITDLVAIPIRWNRQIARKNDEIIEYHRGRMVARQYSDESRETYDDRGNLITRTLKDGRRWTYASPPDVGIEAFGDRLRLSRFGEGSKEAFMKTPHGLVFSFIRREWQKTNGTYIAPIKTPSRVEREAARRQNPTEPMLVSFEFQGVRTVYENDIPTTTTYPDGTLVVFQEGATLVTRPNQDTEEWRGDVCVSRTNAVDGSIDTFIDGTIATKTLRNKEVWSYQTGKLGEREVYEIKYTNGEINKVVNGERVSRTYPGGKKARFVNGVLPIARPLLTRQDSKALSVDEASYYQDDEADVYEEYDEYEPSQSPSATPNTPDIRSTQQVPSTLGEWEARIDLRSRNVRVAERYAGEPGKFANVFVEDLLIKLRHDKTEAALSGADTTGVSARIAEGERRQRILLQENSNDPEFVTLTHESLAAHAKDTEKLVNDKNELVAYEAQQTEALRALGGAWFAELHDACGNEGAALLGEHLSSWGVDDISEPFGRDVALMSETQKQDKLRIERRLQSLASRRIESTIIAEDDDYAQDPSYTLANDWDEITEFMATGGVGPTATLQKKNSGLEDLVSKWRLEEEGQAL